MANYRTFKDYNEAKEFAMSVDVMEFNFDPEFCNYEVFYK